MIKKLLLIIIFLFLYFPLYGQVANSPWAYNPLRNNGVRYCNNPNCIMCNSIWGPMFGYSLTPEGRSYKAPKKVVVQKSLPVEPAQPAPVKPAPPKQQTVVINNPLPPEEIPKISSLHNFLYNNIDPEEAHLLQPMEVEAVRAMLKIINPKSNQVLYDLGCGDGRIIALASKHYGCKSVGIEINPDSVYKARDLINMMEVSRLASVIEGDILDQDLGGADIITMYLFPDLISQILPKIKSGTLVVSYGHQLYGKQTTKKIVKINEIEYEFFIWIAE